MCQLVTHDSRVLRTLGQVYLEDDVLGRDNQIWYESHANPGRSLTSLNLAVARINSHADLSKFSLTHIPQYRQTFSEKVETIFLVLINADVLTISRGDNISGAYLATEENVYRRVKSVHMKGKFHTDFKEETLPGWYDQIQEDVYLKRNQVKLLLS